MVGTDKRERQKANRAKKLEEQHRQQKKAGVRQRVVLFTVIALLVLGVLFVYSMTGDDDTDASTDSPTATTDAGATTTVAPTENGPMLAVPTDEELTPIDPECPPMTGADRRSLQFSAAPPMCIDQTKTYQAVVSTSMGDFTIELDAQRAPNTVNNFVFLANHHYYDGVGFHRIITDFVIQGGDAVGEAIGSGFGTGGPGYQFDDELPEAGEYELGSVVMANSGPDTNGSQFFVITGDQGVGLPPQYALFGKVVDGLDVPLAIQAVETDSADAPVDSGRHQLGHRHRELIISDRRTSRGLG